LSYSICTKNTFGYAQKILLAMHKDTFRLAGLKSCNGKIDE